MLASRKRRPAGWPLTLHLFVLLAACGGLELKPPSPPVATTNPLNPASVVVQDSVLTTSIDVDLSPILTASMLAVGQVLADTNEAPTTAAANGDSSQATETPAAKGAGTRPAAGEGGWVVIDDSSRWRGRLKQRGLQVQLRDSELIVEATLDYAAVASVTDARKGETLQACGCNAQEWCGGAKGAPLQAVVRWVAPLSVSANWLLTAEPKFEVRTVGKCPLIRVQGQVFDPTTQLLEELTEPGINALSDVLASFQGLRHVAEPLWKGLATPAPSDSDDGPRLHLRPRAMRAESITLLKNQAHVPLRVALSPILNGDTPELESVGWPPPTSVKYATGFRIAAEVELPLSTLERKLANKFVGRRFPDRDTRNVQVTAVKIYGSKGRAAVQMSFEGTAKGEIYFVGQVQADQETEELFLSELALTPESLASLELLVDHVERGDLRLDRVPWIRTTELIDELQQSSTWSLRQSLASLRRSLQSATQNLSIPEHELWVAIGETTFVNAAMDDIAARVLVVTSGRSGLEKRPKKAQ